MKTRIGKIARLPRTIRDEVNRRLDNGDSGPELLAWLNALPEVQRVLAEKFGSRPLTKHNLSDWRRGGYADWAAARDGRAHWQNLIERGISLEQHGSTCNDPDPGKHLSSFLVAELAAALDELHEMKNGDRRWKLMRIISGVLSRLRNDHNQDKRVRLREAREQRDFGQIAASRPQSPSKNLFFSSCPSSNQK